MEYDLTRYWSLDREGALQVREPSLNAGSRHAARADHDGDGSSKMSTIVS